MNPNKLATYQKRLDAGIAEFARLKERARVLQQGLIDQANALGQCREILPFLLNAEDYEPEDPNELGEVEENVQYDVHILRDEFHQLLTERLLNGPPDKALEYLHTYPIYIFDIKNTDFYSGEEYLVPISCYLIDGSKKHEILRRVLDYLRAASPNPELALTQITEGFGNKNSSPVRRWAGHLQDAEIEFLQILLDAAPNGERIVLLPGKNSILHLITQPIFYLFEDEDEPNVARAKYREQQISLGKPIKSPLAEKVGFVVPILLRNGLSWSKIFDRQVIDNIAKRLIEYIDTPYLAEWIAHYPRLYRKLVEITSPDDRDLLRRYLLLMENQTVRDIVLSLEDEQSLPRQVMGVIDEETEKLRRRN